MKYSSPTNLSELTDTVDRAQRLLDRTLTDIENMPPSSPQFRLKMLKQVIDGIYRLTSIRKTMIALRASTKRNAGSLRDLTAMVYAIHRDMTALRSRTKNGAPASPPAGAGASSPPYPESTPHSPNTSPLGAPASLPAEPSVKSVPSVDQSESSPIQNQKPKIQNSPTPRTAPAGNEKTSPAVSDFDIRASHFPPQAAWSSHRPPTLEQLIPQARFPKSLTQKSQSGAHSFGAPASSPAGTGASSPPYLAENGCVPPSIKSDSSETSELSDPLGHLGSNEDEPDPHAGKTDEQIARETLATLENLKTKIANSKSNVEPWQKLVDSLAARIPASLYDPDFKVPQKSNRAADYAPLHDLDLVPLVNAVPTLPLTAPDLPQKIDSQFDTITNTAINLRADILYKKPVTSHPSHISHASPPPSDPCPSTLDPSQSHNSHASHSSHDSHQSKNPELNQPPDSS